MGFGESVASFWSKYVEFGGRARRSEYWWVVLFLVLVNIPLAIVDAVIFTDMFMDFGIGVAGIVFSLAVFLPSLSLFVRRLHDVGMSGWLALLLLVPLAGFFFGLVISLIDSQRGANQFGESGKYPDMNVEVPERGNS